VIVDEEQGRADGHESAPQAAHVSPSAPFLEHAHHNPHGQADKPHDVKDRPAPVEHHASATRDRSVAGREAGDSQEEDAVEASPPAEDESAAAIFERRILPIARSDKASSCTECHFGGVELKNYIRHDQAATFATLRDEGLIDVENPDQSKLLEFIGRRSEATTPLQDKVRRVELQAFRAWIHAAVRDPEILAAKSTGVSIGSELPDEVIRHMRRDRVLQSFVENVWSEIGRCVGCHSPERNQKQVEKHGEQMSWIRPRDPAGTLAEAVEQGIIDTADPEESLILLKPLVLVEHGGGPKFAIGSRTDRNFRRFLTDYAAVVNRQYERADQLPPPSPEVAALTGQHLRITDLPRELDKKLLRADLHRWTGEGWSDTPWGTAENPINGEKNVWQSMVFAVAPRGSERGGELQQSAEARLPGGRYLIKIYIDVNDKTKQDRDYQLGAAEFYGEVETDGDWAPGYQPPKMARAPRR
jgi:hypothetical protein